LEQRGIDLVRRAGLKAVNGSKLGILEAVWDRMAIQCMQVEPSRLTLFLSNYGATMQGRI